MFLLVTLWLRQVMIDFERIIAIINCNQQRMRIITQRKGKKAETWLSNILIDGKVISWLLMTDFSTVSTSANPVGEKGKEWLCYKENYCPRLIVFIRNGWTGLEKNCRPSRRTISVWQDCSLGGACLERLWIVLLACPGSAQLAFIPFKRLHPQTPPKHAGEGRFCDITGHEQSTTVHTTEILSQWAIQIVCLIWKVFH